MKVLFVTSADLDAAGVKHAYWVAEQLVRRGHHTVLSLSGHPAIAHREGVAPRSGLHLVYHRFSGRRLNQGALDTVRRFEPTVIHAWNPQVPCAEATRQYSAATGAPFFVHWEDDDWTMRKGMPGRPLHRVVGFRCRQALAHLLPAMGGGFSNERILAWIAREAMGLDALTSPLADEVARRLGRQCAVLLPVTPPYARHVCSAARPTEFSLPAAANQRAVVTYTGTIGTPNITDLSTSLRAMAELARSGKKVLFVHAGFIAPRYDVGRLVQQAGLDPESVLFLGYVPFTTIPALLARSDVLIQPGSNTRFNRLRLPSKMQAYLASGTPTISFAAGLAEMLTDRQEVLKLHNGSASELADRITEVIDDPALAERLAHGAREASDRLFDPERNVQRLLDYYGSALGGAATVL